MPTALLLAAESPRMSVRKRANAIEQMTALLGSAARWPQVSARSKPLRSEVSQEHRRRRQNQAYPAVNISIRCCSVVPGSSLFRSPENIPSCFRRALPAARFTSIISFCSMSLRGGMQ